MMHVLIFYEIVINIIVILIEFSDIDDLIGCCILYNRLIKCRNVYKLNRVDFNFLAKVFYKYRRIIVDHTKVHITNFVEIMFHLIKLGDRANSNEDLNNIPKKFLSDIDLNAPSPSRCTSLLESRSMDVIYDSIEQSPRESVIKANGQSLDSLSGTNLNL